MSYVLIAWIAANAGFALGAYWKASRVEMKMSAHPDVDETRAPTGLFWARVKGTKR